MKDVYFAAAIFIVLLTAYIFVPILEKVKVIELMMTACFGAMMALLQARARYTNTGDIVEKKTVEPAKQEPTEAS